MKSIKNQIHEMDQVDFFYLMSGMHSYLHNFNPKSGEIEKFIDRKDSAILKFAVSLFFAIGSFAYILWKFFTAPVDAWLTGPVAIVAIFGSAMAICYTVINVAKRQSKVVFVDYMRVRTVAHLHTAVVSMIAANSIMIDKPMSDNIANFMNDHILSKSVLDHIQDVYIDDGESLGSCINRCALAMHNDVHGGIANQVHRALKL